MVQYHSAITLALVGGVALLSLLLAVLAVQAKRRTGNGKLAFVAWAFVLFFAKSMLTVYALLRDPSQTATVDPAFPLGHGHLEYLGSAFDLAIVLLLVAPFLRRRGGAQNPP